MTALLLSNSQQPGRDVFEHAQGWMTELFKENSTVMYVPYGVAEVTGDPYEEDENPQDVLGTREGSAVFVGDDGKVTLLGNTTAVYFRKGYEPVELQPGPLDLN